jgi:16S rRNA processing protein RimM
VNENNASPVPATIHKDKEIVLGHLAGVHGIKGWVKVHSYTDPREAIFNYQPWLLGDSAVKTEVLEGKASGKFLLARLRNVETRDAAEALQGQKIAVGRSSLPTLQGSEFYWADLVGLKVLNQDGAELGQIREMLATGANDVMVVEGDRERLIPFVMGHYVNQVDLERGFVTVDWDADF